MTQRHPPEGQGFTPAIVTAWREGYSLPRLRADLLAGLTVAVVALPLSMAIAIASGVPPDRGLVTAIVGGFLVSALGGSRFQVGGPAGAFIVLVSVTVTRHGLDGLVLATALSGLILAAMGALRLGALVRLVPYPVTVGFTAGIGLIIFASQLRPLMGLSLTAPEPGPFLAKLPMLWSAMPTVNPAAVALALATAAIIVTLRRWRPLWPGMLIAVALAALVGLGLDVETIESKFGGIPNGLPLPRLPVLSTDLVLAVLPEALAFAVLGAIESLLSATVADAMSGRRHRPNAELVAQGLANVGAALFGGFCVTGTIARTATNVRAGATGPVAGMAHALVLALFVLVAAPLAGPIPLSALAGVLVVVAVNMIEVHAMRRLAAAPGEALVLALTLVLTVTTDLIEAIAAGLALSGLLYVWRSARGTVVELVETPGLPLCRIQGPFFFGSAARVETELGAIAPGPLVVDLSRAGAIDSTAVEVLVAVSRQRGGALTILGCPPHAIALMSDAGLTLA